VDRVLNDASTTIIVGLTMQLIALNETYWNAHIQSTLHLFSRSTRHLPAKGVRAIAIREALELIPKAVPVAILVTNSLLFIMLSLFYEIHNNQILAILLLSLIITLMPFDFYISAGLLVSSNSGEIARISLVTNILGVAGMIFFVSYFNLIGALLSVVLIRIIKLLQSYNRIR
jgi:hypothetical protein